MWHCLISGRICTTAQPDCNGGIFYGGEPFAKSPASKSLQGPNIYWQETFAPNTHALAAGYDRAFLIAAGVTLVAAAVAVLLPGRDAERPSSSQVANEV
jgi:hypothetical protein